LKAVEKVCPSHLGGFGTSTGEVTSEGATIAVRCGGETVGNVLVTFTGVRTPNVCGLSLNLARDRLDLIGLSVGSVTRSKAITAEVDLVLEQSPRRGAVVAAGTEIDLVVAGG
jgi:beta-lactam-binding protein with PASTA domain